MVAPAPDAQGTQPAGSAASTVTTVTTTGQPNPGWWDHRHPRLSTHHTMMAQDSQGDQGGTHLAKPNWGSRSTHNTTPAPPFPRRAPERGRMRPPASTSRCHHHTHSHHPHCPSHPSLSSDAGDSSSSWVTLMTSRSLPDVVGPQGNLQLPEHLRRLLHSPLELGDRDSHWHCSHTQPRLGTRVTWGHSPSC